MPAVWGIDTPMTRNQRQMVFALPFRPASGREDFWVSPSNENAVAWIDRWPDWPAPVLIIHGPAASGKTHLLQVWQDKAKGWAIDDVDAMIGDHAAEEDLFHRYNRLKEEGGTALMTAAAPPSEWKFTLPDLRSRLVAQNTVAIDLPDDDLLRALIVKLVADRRLEVGADVINYMLMRTERSFAAVHDLIERADRLALASKKAITIPLLRQLWDGESAA